MQWFFLHKIRFYLKCYCFLCMSASVWVFSILFLLYNWGTEKIVEEKGFFRMKKKEIWTYYFHAYHRSITSFRLFVFLSSFHSSTTMPFGYFMWTMYAHCPESWLNVTIEHCNEGMVFAYFYCYSYNFYSTFQLNVCTRVFIHISYCLTIFEPILNSSWLWNSIRFPCGSFHSLVFLCLLINFNKKIFIFQLQQNAFITNCFLWI